MRHRLAGLETTNDEIGASQVEGAGNGESVVTAAAIDAEAARRRREGDALHGGTGHRDRAARLGYGHLGVAGPGDNDVARGAALDDRRHACVVDSSAGEGDGARVPAGRGKDLIAGGGADDVEGALIARPAVDDAGDAALGLQVEGVAAGGPAFQVREAGELQGAGADHAARPGPGDVPGGIDRRADQGVRAATTVDLADPAEADLSVERAGFGSGDDPVVRRVSRPRERLERRTGAEACVGERNVGRDQSTAQCRFDAQGVSPPPEIDHDRRQRADRTRVRAALPRAQILRVCDAAVHAVGKVSGLYRQDQVVDPFVSREADSVPADGHADRQEAPAVPAVRGIRGPGSGSADSHGQDVAVPCIPRTSECKRKQMPGCLSFRGQCRLLGVASLGMKSRE